MNRKNTAAKEKRSSYLTAACIVPLFFLSSNTPAQTFEEIAAKYPNNYAVIQNYSKFITITLKDGLPFAETRTEQEILVLDDKANGIYNKQYVYNSSYNELKELEAYTKVPDGKKYIKQKVTDIKTESSRGRSVFYDDTKQSSFDLPSLVKGATGFTGYTQTHKDVHLLSPFYLVSYMPIVHEKFTVTFPAGMEIKYSIRNDADKAVQVTEDTKGRQHTYTFTANDIKPAERFSNAPSYAYYEPHIIIQLASYTNDNGEKVNYLDGVNDLYKWNYGFISQLDNTKEALLKQLSDSLTAGISSPQEKAKAIYQWVQGNIKYVAFEDGLEGFIPRRAADVCTRRYGDCKDMASILTSLLQLAGLNAYFTWIGTRDIPYDYTEVALPITDNHMIAALNIDSNWIFLDGTDPNCIFGLPSSGIQGKQALIAISKDDYKIIRVPEVNIEKNILVDSTYISITGNGIKGFSSVYYNGYWGNDVYNRLMFSDAKETKDYVKQRMGKASNKFILGDYTINKLNNNNKLVNIQAGFEVPDYGKNIADELFINMNLEKFFANEIIDVDKRKIPVENEYKYIIKQYTLLELPKSYSVSYLPKDYSLSNEVLSFSIKYSQHGNKIIASQELRNNSLLLQPKDFAVWNNALKQLNNQYQEQVVLEKMK
ncbi:MAG TPA: DUF3857 and transglutaminase domain-containing protein [Panacibacter sp.]|nr:DUF3857 and transglutaminase domain-containing protein [Panacibacter sp.]